MASVPKNVLRARNKSLEKRVEDLERAVAALQHTTALRVGGGVLGAPPRPVELFPHDPFTLPAVATRTSHHAS